MGEIWEIIPSQSGHHSWLAHAFPSLPAHVHIFAYTLSSEVHAGANANGDIHTNGGIGENCKKCVSEFNWVFPNPS